MAYHTVIFPEAGSDNFRIEYDDLNLHVFKDPSNELSLISSAYDFYKDLADATNPNLVNAIMQAYSPAEMQYLPVFEYFFESSDKGNFPYSETLRYLVTALEYSALDYIEEEPLVKVCKGNDLIDLHAYEHFSEQFQFMLNFDLSQNFPNIDEDLRNRIVNSVRKNLEGEVLEHPVVRGYTHEDEVNAMKRWFRQGFKKRKF
ncbi:hypothetical protein D6777_03565 [Candidatus Woesearchaeota archaeon]|nr:MAG: hypothetical protein D6777_03565 [Candidatus Woesearchaeota archaeon]